MGLGGLAGWSPMPRPWPSPGPCLSPVSGGCSLPSHLAGWAATRAGPILLTRASGATAGRLLRGPGATGGWGGP